MRAIVPRAIWTDARASPYGGIMRGLLFIGWLVLALAARPAIAADVSVITSVQGTSDSNLFRLPPDLKRQQGKSASDRIATAQALVLIEKDWQDIQIDGHAAARYTAFARNTGLNNLGYDLGADAAKQGSISSITLTASIQRRLASFQDVRTTGRSIQSFSTVSGVATHALLGNFRAILGGDFAQSTNSDARIAIGDYRRFGVRFGFGYYSPTGNIAAIEGRVARSAGLHQSALTIGGTTGLYKSSYDERSIEGHLLYKPSVLLAFEGRLGVSDHKDHSIFHQNFTKPIGEAQLTWLPRQTLRFSIEGRRSFQVSSGILSNGVRANSVKASAVLQITNRLALTANYNRTWSTYLLSLTQNGLTSGHKERTGTIEGQLSYNPGSRFSVQLSAQHADRASADLTYRYKQTQVSLTVSARFGADATSSSRS